MQVHRLSTLTNDGFIMTLADFRPLLERPFRHYGGFSGRSGRTEFWLFILTIFVLTNIAWIAGFGAMKLAGYDSHHHGTERHDHYSTSGSAPEEDDRSGTIHGKDDGTVTFKIHRHKGDEEYHLHGSFAPPLDYHGSVDEDAREDRGNPDSRIRFHMRYDDRTDAEDGAEVLQGIVTLALLIPLLAVGARRLHDSGKSGWWQLFVLIPLAGWLVLVIFFLVPGDPKKNRFGAPPG